MPRQELNLGDIKTEQKSPIIGDHHLKDREPIIERADESILGEKDHLDLLAFGEEPVTIRLEPSTDKNAAAHFPIWVNGKGCEVWQNNRWEEITYLPIGRVVTVKRKYVAVLASAKLDSVKTEIQDENGEHPDNRVTRFTSAIQSFSIIEDKNPRGIAWLTDLRRRNF